MGGKTQFVLITHISGCLSNPGTLRGNEDCVRGCTVTLPALLLSCCVTLEEWKEKIPLFSSRFIKSAFLLARLLTSVDKSKVTFRQLITGERKK